MNDTTSAQILSNIAPRFGASQDDWITFDLLLGLGADLLPVVSNPNAQKSPHSDLGAPGKAPSMYDRQRLYMGIPKWTQKLATPDELAAWAREPDYGLCLQTRQVRALDIDATDPALVAEICSVIALHLGALPARRRPNSAKCLFAFRLPGDISKRSFLVAPKQKLEFLATGQQFVAVGTHPSGVRYEWIGGLPDEFPEITLDQFEALWSALVTRFAIAAPGQDGAGVSQPVDEIERAAVLMSVDDTVLTELKSALGVDPSTGRPWLDFNDHDTWVNVGHDLASLKGTEYESDARELWLCWGAAGDTFNDGKKDPIATWDGLTADRADYRGVFAKAARAGWPNPRKAVLESERERSTRIASEGTHKAPTQRVMTGSEMLQELVYVADGARVAFMDEPRFALPFPEFKNFTAGSIETTKGAKGQSSKVLRAALWLAHPDRKTVRVQTFAPGRERVCTAPDGEIALNLWVPRADATPANWRELAQPFFDHVEYLVPDQAERERFLHWLAHIEQRPGELPHTHYLLVAKQTGIGRNWLAYALARVFAGYVALGFDLGESLRSGFNGALSQRLLAVVDELHEGGPNGSNSPRAEKLKSMLTEATRRVNPKYGRQHVEFNCCRFLMFSNHEAALPLAENDRRVVVIENPSQRRGADYYANLYRLLDHPGLGAAIAEALKQHDISAFNPGEVAPMSDAKRKTIRAGRSEIEQAVRDLAAEWPSDCITSGRLHAAVSDALGTKVASTQAACVSAGIAKYSGRVRVGGVPSHVWILRNHQQWSAAPAGEVAGEVMRGLGIADFDLA